MNLNRPIEILIILIAIGAPILKKIFESLAEQRAKSQAAAARQRRVEELLRTGNATGEPRGTAAGPSKADALAKRRQAQLEEMRRRAAQRAGGDGARASRSAPPSRPTQRKERPAGKPGARATSGVKPPPRGAAPGGTRGAGRGAGARGTPTAGPRPAARPTPVQPETPRRRLVADVEPMAPLDASRPMTDAASDLLLIQSADWRRAVLMREILDLPVSLRDGETS